MSEEAQASTVEKKKRRAAIEKNNSVLEKLDVEYMLVDAIRPNSYNPNRQSDHDFSLLCRSIAEDGFTQPIVVHRATKEIVDGEHRWRACKALGYEEVPVVLVDMSPEQMRIATLRHNRARGSEDAALAGEVLKQIAELGQIEFAQDALMMDDVEVERMMKEMGAAEATMISTPVPIEQLGPTGKGMSEIDKSHAIDHAADELRAREKMLAEAKKQEEKSMMKNDQNVYRLVLFFTGEEAAVIKRVLDPGEGAAKNLLRICQEEAALAKSA